MALALRLRRAGYETSLAYDAPTGINAALKLRPHLVLLDVSIPAGDGFVVVERMQAKLSAPPPVIFLTASKQPSLRRRAEALGAAGYFEKPYEAEVLLKAIRCVLEDPSEGVKPVTA